MEFQGFQNLISPLFIGILVVLILVLSWYSYKDKARLSRPIKIVLIGLRTSSLLLLLLLLMNPFFFSEQIVEIEPGIAVYLDDSESIDISKNDYDGAKTALQTINNFINSINENIDPVIYSFSSEVSGLASFDSLTFNAKETNISKVIADILEQDDDIRAAVIFTDGIYTFGRDPFFASSNSSIPIYIIGLGDSSVVKDQAISDIFYPSTVYNNSIGQIEVEIQQNGYDQSTTRLNVYRGDKLRFTRDIEYIADDQVLTESFSESFDEPGLFQYRVEIEPLQDEFSDLNNSSAFSIEVKDSKVSILDIAFELHPDIRSVRSVLLSDQNYEVDLKSYYNRSDVVSDPPNSAYDLIVVHGQPAFQISAELRDLIQDHPTVHFSLPGSYRNNTNLSDLIKLIGERSNRLISSSLESLVSKDDQAIMELDNLNFSDFPPLISPYATELNSPRFTALFSGTYQGSSTNNPLIVVSEEGNIRRSHVFLWNWYKWYLSNNEIHRTSFIQLISNISSWTHTDYTDELLIVRSPRVTYGTDQRATLNATLINESGDRESDSIIEIMISREEENIGVFNMQPDGNGTYRVELPRFGEGLYTFKATARKGTRLIDTDEGGFLISDTNDELNSTVRNDEMLTRISGITNGQYAGYTQWKEVADSINQNPDLQVYSSTESAYSFPVRNMIWFMIVLGLLIAEWGIRKYYSLP